MDFKEALDGLCARVDHEDVARALGVSTQAVRQARLGPDAKARRHPPENWRQPAIRMAEERVWHFRQLIEELRSSEGMN